MINLNELTERYSRKSNKELKEIIAKNGNARKRENKLMGIVLGAFLSFAGISGVYSHLDNTDKESAKEIKWTVPAVGITGSMLMMGYAIYCRTGKRDKEYLEYRTASGILKERTKED